MTWPCGTILSPLWIRWPGLILLLLVQGRASAYSLTLGPGPEAGRTVLEALIPQGDPAAWTGCTPDKGMRLSIGHQADGFADGRCLVAEVDGGPGSWNLVFRTPPGLLHRRSRYRIGFGYAVDGAWEPGCYAYLFIRAEGEGARWRPQPALPGGQGEVRQLQYEFLTGEEDGCRVAIGVHGKGQLRLGAVRIEALPSPPLPEAGDGRGGSWRDFAGVCAHPEWRYFYRDDDEVRRTLDRLQELGVGWMRFTLPWDQLMPARRGSIDATALQRLDLIVDEAGRRGIRLLGILIATPGWASLAGDAEGAWRWPARERADYEEYIRFLAGRYRGRVAAWEVNNEPDWDVFWRAPFTAYLADLRTAARIIRSLDPAAVILNGGLTDTLLHGLPGSRPEALRSLLSPEVAGDFDALSLHLYPGDPEEMVYALRQVVGLARSLGSSKPIWVTETGCSASAGRSQEDQAVFLVRTMRLLAAYAPVERVFLYNERVKDFDRDERERGFGLMAADWSPQPAFLLLRTLFHAGTVRMP